MRNTLEEREIALDKERMTLMSQNVPIPSMVLQLYNTRTFNISIKEQLYSYFEKQVALRKLRSLFLLTHKVLE